jgi:tRNA A-37 threonylcarbamoyl transferase component Bud32
MLLLTEQDDASLVEAIRQAGLDRLDGAFAFAGGTDLDKPGLGARRRTRLHLADSLGHEHLLYLKRYSRLDARGRLLAVCSAGRAGSQAWREMRNIQAVRAAGVATMQVLAWAQRGDRSYILVTAVPGEAIERCGNAFFARYGQNMGICDSFTWELASLAARLHQAGLFHRDLYASHVFLDFRQDVCRLFLIDLARVIRPRLRHFRWRVKDLAQLKYSMPERWKRQYWDAFLDRYCHQCHRSDMESVARAIDAKVRRISRHEMRRRARRIRGPKR